MAYRSFDFVRTENDAVTAAAIRTPDIIIADQRLAQGSGVDAVHIIRATRPIPVVFISGYRLEIRGLLPDAIVIGKPFSEQTLREAVLQAVLLS